MTVIIRTVNFTYNPNLTLKIFFFLVTNCNSCVSGRGSGVRELRRHQHPSLAAGRHGTLPLQRMRPLLQDEWTK